MIIYSFLGYILDNLKNSLTSPQAIFIYIAIIFVILAIVFIMVITNENDKDKSNKQLEKNNVSLELDRILNEVNKKIDDVSFQINDKIDLLNVDTSLDDELENNHQNEENHDIYLEEVKSNDDLDNGDLHDSYSNEVESNLDEIEENLLDNEIQSTNSDGPIEVNTTDTRFYMLNQIDLEYEDKEKELFKDNISLEDICNDFRNFSASRLKLYYDISDIRRFIAGLSVTKLLILQGMSGTGKTSLAYAFGEFLDNKAVVVPIQPMWKERTDLIGYYNEFTRKFNETTLLYKMYEANYNPQIYITVLDEMNIARVEYYFAEFLSLLELPNPEGRNLDVVSDVWPTDPKLLNKGKLRLPTNMWFIGTANNDDSTFAISDKVYDRAMVINLDTKAEVFEAEAIEPKRITSEFLQAKFDEAIKEYKLSQRNLRRLQMLDKYLIDKFHITFGNRIMKQIQIYAPVMVACGGSELDALDDIISRKILRKLESKNPVYVKSQSEALCNYIDEVFGVDKMPLCKNAIYTIEQNA